MSDAEYGRALLRILADATRLGERVVSHCIEVKPPFAFSLWVFSLLARVCTAARATQLLIRHGLVHDARMLNRCMGDAMQDICYILHGPLSLDKLTEFLLLEMAEDRHDELKYYSVSKRMNPSHVASRIRGAPQVLRDYEAAQKNLNWSNRWRHVKDADKRRVLRDHIGDWDRLLRYPIETLGNAAAHARPIIIQHYVAERDGELSAELKPAPGMLYSTESLACTALVCMLVATNLVVEGFYLPNEFDRCIKRLISRWRRAQDNRPTQSHDHLPRRRKRAWRSTN